MSGFDRIAGYKKEKEELLTLVKMFKYKKKYELKGATLPKGIIFYGAPGTGKTLFAEVLAEECMLKKINISISDSVSAYNICKKIRNAFTKGEKAREPVMVFFDELDKVLPNKNEDYYSDRSKTILAQLLTLIDGMEKASNVVFVATCNDYYSLPDSLIRAGRFDKKIGFDLPDFTSRTEILDMYKNATPAIFQLSSESIAKLIGGFSPAAIKTLINDCLIESDENNFVSETIIRKKILEIKEENVVGDRSDHSYTVDAIRNIGSFIVARSYSNSDYVLNVEENKVCNVFLDSIIAKANHDYDNDDDYYDDDSDCQNDSDSSNTYALATNHDYIAAITALMGGYAAQELIFGKIFDNLKKSFDTIEAILINMSSCGMLGFKYYYNYYHGNDLTYSEKFLIDLESELLKIMQECYEKAKAQIEKNEILIKKLLPILIKRKSIEKKECENILAELGGISV